MPRSNAFARVDAEVERFKAGTPARELQTSGWVTQQWQHFLSQLPARLRETQLRQLDEAFAFSKTGNSEVLFAWLRDRDTPPLHAGLASARALPHVTGTAEVPAAALSGLDGQRLGQGGSRAHLCESAPPVSRRLDNHARSDRVEG